MRLIQKLKGYENRYVYMKWTSGGEYGKIKYVGEDFVEFDIVDVDSMSYQETVLIYAPLILEVSVGGSDISRIVAEISSQLTP